MGLDPGMGKVILSADVAVKSTDPLNDRFSAGRFDGVVSNEECAMIFSVRDDHDEVDTP